MYVYTTLKKRKMTKAPLETEAGEDAYEMKEEDLIDNVYYAVSSTLSKEGKTVFSKFINEMAEVCSINEVGLRNLDEDHEFAAEEDLTRKVEIVLTNLPYNILRDQYDDRAEYDVFRWSDINEIADVLGDVVRPGAHVQILCSSPHFTAFYSALVSEKRKRHPVP